jgi:hypothetical protein
VEPKIFITYSSKDQKVARTICTALENRGLACWISSRNVKPGQNYQEQIVRAIRGARVMVLVFTTNANNSNEIKKELALASQNNLVVIPVRIEDVAPNEAFAYEFATRQWIDLFEDWEKSMAELVELIAAILNVPSAGDPAKAGPGATGDAAAPAFFTGGTAPASATTRAVPFMQRPATRWAMTGLAVIVAAAVTYTTVTFSQRPSSTSVTTSGGTPTPSNSPDPNQKAASVIAPADISGKYSVRGTNTNGTTYHGTVTIQREGNRYRFDWLISNAAAYSGIGMRNGGSIVVDWGQKYPVIYQLGPDGVLTGTWNNGTATETLVPD